MRRSAPPAAAASSSPLREPLPRYRELARELREQIARGTLRPGDKLPSVRDLARERSLSITTVLEAYQALRAEALIEAHARSGFFVRDGEAQRAPEPSMRKLRAAPAFVGTHEIIDAVCRAGRDPAMCDFGAACPSPELLPIDEFNRITRGVLRANPGHSARYELTEGLERLRRAIAVHTLRHGTRWHPGDLAITAGANEALHLALSAVTKPGDVVAIESPSYFGILQAIECFSLRALPIPTHPRQGIEIEALADALQRHRVAAIVVQPTAHNPLGCTMSDVSRRALVELASRHEIPLIADDVYGDLLFEGPVPKALAAYDRKQVVIQLSSFSKSLGPGLRIGYVHGARWHDEIVRLKHTVSISTASLPQLVMAEYLERGVYERHLRRLRRHFSEQIYKVSDGIRRSFPAGTRLSRPTGGFVLWVEVPGKIDTLALHRRALREGISISPGPIFSPRGEFANCLRLNCGRLWTEKLERALTRLGQLVSTM